MNIFIRTDSAINIGSGHVMRCLNLADGLSDAKDTNIIFICKNHQGNLGELIKERGYNLELMDNSYEPTLDIKTWLGGGWKEDALETSKILLKSNSSSCSPIWLIIDHYNIYKNWEETIIKNLKNLNLRILVIDDYYDKEHLAHIVVNQMYHKNMNIVTNKYKELIHPFPLSPKFIPIILLGTKYCLLNKEIIKYKKHRKRKTKLSRVLLTLGGNDPENVTLEIIKTLSESKLNCDIEIEIIIGKSNPHHSKISEYISKYGKSKPLKFNLHQGIKQEEVFKILQKCDFAIGAIGVSMYERLCIGVPSMVVSIAENQVSICQEMNELIIDLGIGLKFDKKLLIQKVNEWANDGQRLEEIRTKYQNLCDGKGVSKIVEHIIIC